MERKESFDKLKEKILKLKQSSQRLSDRITKSIAKPVVGGVTAPKEETQDIVAVREKEVDYQDRIREQESIIAEQEQKLQYVSNKLANVELAKKELLAQVGDLIKSNNGLMEKLNDFEKEREGLRLGMQVLGKQVDESGRDTSLKHILEIVEQFVSEFMRHSRDTLGMIYESIDMCIGENTPGPVKEKIKVVEEQVKYLLNVLTESVKKYHFEKIEFKPVDLNRLVSDTVNNAVKQYSIKGIMITNKFPEKPVVVSTEPDLMAEAVENIVLNAAESIVKDGKMDITCESFIDSAVLHINDNGTGIPEHLAGKIYRPFVTTKRGHYGLGLTRVYWIIKLLNCEIKIDSIINQGTKVTIVIPVSQNQEAGQPGAEGQERTGEQNAAG